MIAPLHALISFIATVGFLAQTIVMAVPYV